MRSQRSTRRTTENASITNGNGQDELYQLETLKGYQVVNGVEYFLVKWEGYPDSQNTWEPVSNLVSPTPELIKQMGTLRNRSEKKTKGKKRRMEPGRSPRVFTRPRKSQRHSLNSVSRGDSPKDDTSQPPMNLDEDTSPEGGDLCGSFCEVATQTTNLESPNGTIKDGVELIREEVEIPQLFQERTAQPYCNQENRCPQVSADLHGFLARLTCLLKFRRTWREVNGTERVETSTERRALLETVESHTRPLLWYFLRNVRYVAPSKGERTTEKEVNMDKEERNEIKEIGDEIEADGESSGSNDQHINKTMGMSLPSIDPPASASASANGSGSNHSSDHLANGSPSATELLPPPSVLKGRSRSMANSCATVAPPPTPVSGVKRHSNPTTPASIRAERVARRLAFQCPTAQSSTSRIMALMDS
eukprot:Protomagalhaensia_sp_Gyna_25__607@NODE_1287_length_1980_cov_338_804740_g1026_i0_p1_GENE_NODE_1287_length_1980_cov_338_804740_g1026_i0NODE_1287_length_1980_cov_338_804740_g1026_i0_p1_ORF_typecomplete_len420_score47_42Chromo/PF00385_24/3_8e10_NODE_1287_length_1980_cov_338_804740_g1026_i03801639